MTSLYRLTRITKRYGARTVLAIEALSVREATSVALIGPSGAGKSTLLRLLCFLEAPTAGTLEYRGSVVGGPVSLPVQREVTLVFQRPLVLDTSVERNIAYPLQLRGQRDNARVAQMLSVFGLERLAKARARTLSGGEMQRVALARALVLRPRVLLLDEPTANLDPNNVALIERALLELRAAYPLTLVVATHNLHQALRLAEQTAFMLDGQLIEVGPTGQMLQQPNDPRTLAFVTGGMVY